jgi:oxygen-independent coproporphyrinogen-3 oxidase
MELAMYESAIEILASAGFEHYEVSNFARPGHRCRHNVTYWQGGEYLAFGPGAARFVGGWRETNHRSTTAYLNRVLSGQSPVAERESLPPRDRARERFVFHMRMLEGVPREAFRKQTGITVDQLLGGLLADFVAWGLLEDDGDRIRLTRQGLLVSDALWARVLTEEPGVEVAFAGRGSPGEPSGGAIS